MSAGWTARNIWPVSSSVCNGCSALYKHWISINWSVKWNHQPRGVLWSGFVKTHCYLCISHGKLKNVKSGLVMLIVYLCAHQASDTAHTIHHVLHIPKCSASGSESRRLSWFTAFGFVVTEWLLTCATVILLQIWIDETAGSDCSIQV